MKKINLGKSIFAVFLAAFIIAGNAQAATVSGHNQTASGLQGWLLEDGRAHIELNPLLKDQVRAFYLARGFSEKTTEQIADACVFQAVIRNISPENSDTVVDVDLGSWRLVQGENEKPLISKQAWIEKWAAAGASEQALLAFRWATFPERQHFKLSGDYGWGMILFGEQPQGRLDLLVRWKVDDRLQSQRIDGIQCPN